MNAQGTIVECDPGFEPLSQVQSRPRGRGDLSVLQILGQGAAVVVMVVASYFFFSHCVIQSMRVSGASMLPTLRDADFYLVNRFSAWFRAPNRGDIVVLKDPTDQTYAVKRVIGRAGDTVELRDGVILVNGERLSEPYLPAGTQTFPYATRDLVVRCDTNQFFVLGDNRGRSSDSRCYGPVTRSAILGFVIR